MLATKERGGRAACAFSAPFGLRQQPPPCPVTPTHAGSHRSSPSAATARTHRNTHSKRRVAQRAPSVCRPAGGAFLLKQQGLLFCIISPIPSLCGHRQQQQRCCPTTVGLAPLLLLKVGVAKSCNTAAGLQRCCNFFRSKEGIHSSLGHGHGHGYGPNVKTVRHGHGVHWH